MIISRFCQECVHLDTDCEGKTIEQAPSKDGKPPCKRYELNMNFDTDEPEPQDGEPTTMDNIDKNKQQTPELQPVADNKKAQNFVRLAEKRLVMVLDAIRKMDNLTNSYNYQWSYQQGQQIVQAIKDAVNKLEHNFGEQ